MKRMFDLWERFLKKFHFQRLLCLFMLCLSLPLVAQNEVRKVNINVENASLKEVLDVLKKYNYRLVYSTSVIDACKKKVTLDLKKVSASEVLNKAFKNTDLTFRIDKNVITIKQVVRDENITAKGFVTDVSGDPLPGVAVMLKGSLTGTTTTATGHFQMRVPKNSVLTFSFIGMQPQSAFVESEQPIKISMKETSIKMDEVVITGFQVLKKRESTSSIVTLDAEDIIEPVGISLDQMLQGKVPGMAVMQMTSTVGAAPKIRIRGSSTIIGNREPVWVLDGVVLTDPVSLDATELNSMDRVNLIGNAISGLNPEDIDRIDVLKDASATALYGSKAANGVIVITTKRGKIGAPSVRFSTSMSFMQRPSYKNQFRMNSKERIEVSEEIHDRGLEFIGFSPDNVGYEGAVHRLWDGKISMDQFNKEVKRMKEMNTDWYDLLFRNSFSQSYTLSVSGGTKKTDYYFSAGYSKQQGAQMQEQSERFSFMSNLGFQLSERLRADVSLSAGVNTTDRPTVDLNQYAYETSRAIPAYNADGSYVFYGKEPLLTIAETPTLTLDYNVLNELQTSGTDYTTRDMNARLNLSYKIASWLNASAILSYNTSSSRSETWYDERSYYVSKLRQLPYGYDRSHWDKSMEAQFRNSICQIPYGGILSSGNNTNDSYMARVSLNMNKMFKEVHSLSFSVGMETTSTKYKGYDKEEWGYLPGRGKKFVDLENLTDWKYASEKMQSLKPIISDNTTNFLSYYGTFSYGYHGKYIVSANVRGDGSNKLGESARFLPIWSFSGRWNITEENFMMPLTNVLSNLNIRASYGIQANVTDAHNPNLIINLGNLHANSEQFRATLSQLPNRNLEWEKTNSFNAGLDFDFFNGILSGSIEYYYKKSKDQLMVLEVESTNGAKTVTINGGDLTNKGWDLSLSVTPIKTNDFEWNMTFNTSKNRNSVVNALERSESYTDYLNGSIVKNGYALNSFYSYQFAGLDAQGRPTFHGTKDYDEQGNVVVLTREQALASVLKYSGKREADLTGGLSMSFRYKQLALSTRFAMSLGNKIRLNDLYDDNNLRLPFPAQNMSSEFVNRWRKPGDEKHTDIPALSDKVISMSDMNPDNKGRIMNMSNVVAENYWQMYNDSDLRVVSGNFLRCTAISLSYSLPEEMTKKMRLHGASLSLGVSNPFVIKSKDLKGRDPEQVTLGSGTIPPQQSYSLMLNITF